jgi:hypothetical protein
MLNSTEILEQIERLKTLDSERKIFGSYFHDYQLNPCLDEDAIDFLLAKYVIDLPGDYRRFLLEVGNGGAGPYHGLFKLGEHDDGWGFCAWEDGYLLGDPSAPFRYRERWNLPDTFWSEAPHHREWMSEGQSDKAHESWDAKLDEVYWTPAVMNGAIPICHCGCALRQWLVVTGPERGNVWQDDRVDWNGIYPLETKDGGRVTFLRWYVSWLDDSIASIERVDH